MDRLHTLRSIAPVLLLAVSACGGGSGSAGGGGGAGAGGLASFANLGLAVSSVQGRGRLRLLEVPELAQGGGDLNGDGDLDDTVAFVFDLIDLTEKSLELALPPGDVLALVDDHAAFGVSEAAQGAADLNGDGDADDVVLHFYDSATGQVTNSARAAAGIQPVFGAGRVAFAVDESAQGQQDLDGDGASTSAVLHLYDLATGLVTDVRRAVTSAITFHDHAFAYTTGEPAAGADLNGDGDDSDGSIFELFDVTAGATVTVPLAIRGRPVGLRTDDWLVLADEAQENADLDGDGDLLEGVYQHVVPALGTRTSLGLASDDTFGSLGDGFRAALVIQEVDGQDRNGDGDTSDSFLALFDAVVGSVFESGVAIDPNSAPVFAGGGLAYMADEPSSAHDLDADGDELDRVLEVMTIGTGLSLGQGATLSYAESAGLLIFARAEDGAGVAGTDWNGDGDRLDVVTFYLEPASSQVTNTRIASSGEGFASGRTLLLLQDEHGEGRDLDQDGDQDDLVCLLFDRPTKTSETLRTAVVSAGPLLQGKGIVLLAETTSFGDMNFDGDALDLVPWRIIID